MDQKKRRRVSQRKESMDPGYEGIQGADILPIHLGYKCGVRVKKLRNLLFMM